MNNYSDVYKTNEISTASNMKLVILMYDGAIRFLKECKRRIKEGDIPGRGVYISKAQKIISELHDSLDTEKGGEIAQNLSNLYNYLMFNLTKANINADEKLLDESLKVMECLRTGWHDVVTTSSDEPLKVPKAVEHVAIRM